MSYSQRLLDRVRGNEMKIKMVYSKSTKNTHVYVDDRDDAPVPALYIQKSALPGAANMPDITLTIEVMK